jgi:hypothetical protein
MHTVIYGVYIRFWPTLVMCYNVHEGKGAMSMSLDVGGSSLHFKLRTLCARIFARLQCCAFEVHF